VGLVRVVEFAHIDEPYLGTFDDMNSLLTQISSDRGHDRDRFEHMRPGAIIACIVLLALLAGLAFWLVRRRRNPTPTPVLSAAAESPSASAERILAERFARGELPVEEFVTARSALRGEWVAPTQASEAEETGA
jgi:hypothetical protein